MALQTYGITQLTLLPHDIQRIIFNEHVELMSRQRFNEIIYNLPSQLSNDVPNDNIFVDTFDSPPPTLYEKLIQQILNTLKLNATLHNDMDLMQRDRRSAPGSTLKFITHLIIDFINISLGQIKQIKERERERFNVLGNVRGKLMKHIVCENNLHNYNVHNGITYDGYSEQEITDALHILDYRELLQLKCISNSKVLFFDDNLLKEYFVNYLKFNNCRRIIYNPVNKLFYYWINNHIGEPRCICTEYDRMHRI